jgi:hypothetical protein
MTKETRIERIVNEWYAPYNRTISGKDLDHVMEFLKVMLMSLGKFKPRRD